MRFSYDWLCQFLPLDMGPQELAKHLLLLGFEVSDIQTLGPGFEGVVVGRVDAVEKHPNADRLSLCRVSVGGDDLSIVCGAANVAAGTLVPVARIGAKLPGGRSVSKAKIRGIESQGMICSASELGMSKADNGGILILPPKTPVGEDAAKLFGGTDYAMEVEITPNRPDCLSHLGLAREISIYLMKDLHFANPALVSSAASDLRRDVKIEARNACRRYLGREFSEVRVGPSPGWMVRRLEGVGLRSINNLVDITNYVLFELGHPLHIFDSKKLQGPIVARFAKDGEKIHALDRQDYALDNSDLVIADSSGPVALAGIIGGEPTSVTEQTTFAFLESACFNPGTIRRTSKRLKLRTDSSYRFERGTAPESAALASARASDLILELCGKPSAGEWTDAYPSPTELRTIRITTDRINELLGTDHAKPKVEAVLRRMAASIAESGEDQLIFTVPSVRMDLETPWDLAEEVGRLLGYDSIPAKTQPVPLQPEPANQALEIVEALRRKLSGHGFLEAYNYDFVSKAQLALCGLNSDTVSAVEVSNPLSEEWQYLRPTLLPGLLQNAVFNLSRGAENLRLFEIGHVYSQAGYDVSETPCAAGILVGDWPLKPQWREKPKPVDFYDVKGVVEDLMRHRAGVQWIATAERARGLADASLFHPRAVACLASSKGCLGIFGLVHPHLLKAWHIQRPAAAFCLDLSLLKSLPSDPFTRNLVSIFPSSSRDISIIVAESVPYEKIRAIVQETPDLSRLDLIDVYRGEGIPSGKKSLTLRLTFTRQDRTLQDSEVDASITTTLEALKRYCDARLRQ